MLLQFQTWSDRVELSQTLDWLYLYLYLSLPLGEAHPQVRDYQQQLVGQT